MQLKTSTGIWIAGIGAAVTGIGTLIGGRTGSVITGFGLAHVALGVLDNFRPVINKNLK